VLLSFVVLFPYISLVKSSEHVIKDILQNEKKFEKYNFNQCFAITLASLVLLIFLMESDLILSIFGDEYAKASISLLILSTCYLFSGILSSPIEFLNMTGNVKFSLYIVSFSVIINFLVNMYLIPIYSLNGAAIGTSISIIITKILANIIVKKKLNLNLVTISNFTKLIPLIISFTLYLILIKIIHFSSLFTKITFDIFILSLCVFIIFLNDKKMLKNLYNKFDE
jgi:O-antigen/teichoic acid export membrane protein